MLLFVLGMFSDKSYQLEMKYGLCQPLYICVDVLQIHILHTNVQVPIKWLTVECLTFLFGA